MLPGDGEPNVQSSPASSRTRNGSALATQQRAARSPVQRRVGRLPFTELRLHNARKGIERCVGEVGAETDPSGMKTELPAKRDKKLAVFALVEDNHVTSTEDARRSFARPTVTPGVRDDAHQLRESLAHETSTLYDRIAKDLRAVRRPLLIVGVPKWVHDLIEVGARR
jgi:hypothetical protein